MSCKREDVRHNMLSIKDRLYALIVRSSRGYQSDVLKELVSLCWP